MNTPLRPAFLLAFCAGLCLATPVEAFARPAKHAHAKKRKRRKERVTAKTIKAWQRRGLSNKRIVAKARRYGYRVTRKERKRLRRLKVRTSLIRALVRGSSRTKGPRRALARRSEAKKSKRVAQGSTEASVMTHATATTKASRKIDLTEMNPEDIDFDEVAPPAGIPEEHKATIINAPKKTSKRVPFKPGEPKQKRKVIVAKQE